MRFSFEKNIKKKYSVFKTGRWGPAIQKIQLFFNSVGGFFYLKTGFFFLLRPGKNGI